MTSGVTLVEALVSIAVLAILAAVVLGSFSEYRDNAIVSGDAEAVAEVLAQARAKTLAGALSSKYGVRLEAARVILFRGASYQETAADNVITMLSPAVEITSIVLSGGGSEIVFERLTGKAAQTGSFVVRVKSSVSKSNTVSVASSGAISVQ